VLTVKQTFASGALALEVPGVVALKADRAVVIRPDLRRISRALAQSLALVLPCHGALLAQEPSRLVPSFAEIEAGGAIIGEIRILNRDIFDSDARGHPGIVLIAR
jgi:hypothetical protein